ncbi:MAG: HPr-rel-A system PqqD family peptide chaperone [Pseudomonadota bacterium]
MEKSSMREMRWQAVDEADYSITPIGPFYAVFHAPSGATHILTEVALEILRLARPAPLSATELAARLQQEFALEAAGDVPAIVARRIAELDDLGLIAPVL